MSHLYVTCFKVREGLIGPHFLMFDSKHQYRCLRFQRGRPKKPPQSHELEPRVN